MLDKLGQTVNGRNIASDRAQFLGARMPKTETWHTGSFWRSNMLTLLQLEYHMHTDK